MALLNADSYDLTTADGQTEVIQDIIDEQNAQFDQASALQALSIVAYQQLTVTIPTSGASGVYTATYRHGLGFPPLVMGFSVTPGGVPSQYNPLPMKDRAVSPPPIFDNAYISVDSTNLYFNVLAINSGGFVNTAFSAGVYIFNTPAQVS